MLSCLVNVKISFERPRLGELTHPKFLATTLPPHTTAATATPKLAGALAEREKGAQRCSATNRGIAPLNSLWTASRIARSPVLRGCTDPGPLLHSGGHRATRPCQQAAREVLRPPALVAAADLPAGLSGDRGVGTQPLCILTAGGGRSQGGREGVFRSSQGAQGCIFLWRLRTPFFALKGRVFMQKPAIQASTETPAQRFQSTVQKGRADAPPAQRPPADERVLKIGAAQVRPLEGGACRGPGRAEQSWGCSAVSSAMLELQRS